MGFNEGQTFVKTTYVGHLSSIGTIFSKKQLHFYYL